MFHARRLIVLTLCLSFINVGCYDSHRFRTKELEKLDGYRYHDKGLIESTSDLVKGNKAKPNPVMRDIKGRAREFSEDTELIFWLCCGARRSRFEDSYRAIEIDKGVFRGVTNHNSKVGYPLKQIRFVEVEEFDGMRTGILIGGVTLATLTILSVIVLASGGGKSSGGSDWDLD